MDLISFITWIASSGGNISIMSFIAERLPAFQALKASVKQIVFLVGSFVLSLGGYLFLKYVPSEVIAQVSPYFGILYATVASVFAANIFHKMDKLP